MTSARNIGFIVLVDAGDNDVHKIRETLLEIEEIDLVHCLIGPTDLICYGRTTDVSQLKTLMSDRIHALLEDRFNPIERTETMLVLDHYGSALSSETHARPNGTGAWIFADLRISGSTIAEKLLSRHPEIKTAFNVLGRNDTVFYVESETLDSLMGVIDEGFRVLRGIGSEGKPTKALSRTDTRLVLM
ncbi:Lrp/AsnC ligand binding domain-containing protein [Kistimonas asteriae]|uniref:Lrp/AsnC ligand binding domain-containing protein n=1 Tax=Kistimonas asteriae TaxID=517724 RepID=UPI001BAABBA4|nr:Lrp/AsnC ligand binding domain-containing protein [Kistimonas asteriae]